MVKAGNPRFSISTSTSTGTEFKPTVAAEITLASIAPDDNTEFMKGQALAIL